MKQEIFGYFITRCGELTNKHGRVIKFYENQKGYLMTQLRVNGKTKTITQHRLVAIAFIPNPENKAEVDHINGDRKYNLPQNLRWVTRSENVQHSYTSGDKCAIGVNNSRSTFTEVEVHNLCRLFSDGLKAPEVSRLTGSPYNTVRRIRQRATWRHISDHYKW
jgi:hypothetical protein